MIKKKWPLKYRFWRFLHSIVNRLAWRFMPTSGYKDPRKNHWLWKLNDWVANHYTDWFVKDWIKRDKDLT